MPYNTIQKLRHSFGLIKNTCIHVLLLQVLNLKVWKITSNTPLILTCHLASYITEGEKNTHNICCKNIARDKVLLSKKTMQEDL